VGLGPECNNIESKIPGKSRGEYWIHIGAHPLQKPFTTTMVASGHTTGVRLVSRLKNAMNNQGQIGYLKAYHRLGGWFPSEAKDPAGIF